MGKELNEGYILVRFYDISYSEWFLKSLFY